MTSLPLDTITQDSTVNCSESKLGTWLLDAGGGFHPSLVFQSPTQQTSINGRDMGISIFTKQSIFHQDVLASCSVSAIIDRKNSLKAIDKLLHIDFFEKKPTGNQNLHCESPFLETSPSLISCWLDRTVISLYLILSKFSIRLNEPQSGQPDGDQLNLVSSSPVNRAIKELFSFHQDYIRLLPGIGDLMTPLFWNESEIEKLRGTLLYHSLIEQKLLWTSEYKTLMGNISELSPILHDFLSRHICCDDYFWACSIVNSRSFPSTLLATPISNRQEPSLKHEQDKCQKLSNISPPESEPMLLPGVDIFNHKRRAKVEWRSIYLDSQVQRIELIALEDQLAPGLQVFNNYGPKSTAELILGYGFALSEEDWKQGEEVSINNPDDFYTIKLTKPKAAEAFSPLIVKIFNEFKNDDLIHHIRRDGLIPYALLAQLRILVISTEEETAQLDRLYHPNFPLGLGTLKFAKISWLNELNALDCLISLIERKLKDLNEFNHSSNQPTQWNQVRSPIKKMIQIYRQGQRDILESALKQLSITFDITQNEAKSDGFEYDLDDEC